jgi:hypothetical protein
MATIICFIAQFLQTFLVHLRESLDDEAAEPEEQKSLFRHVLEKAFVSQYKGVQVIALQPTPEYYAVVAS